MRMDWEVLFNYLGLDKVAQVEVHVEGLLDDRLGLAIIELFKEVSSVAFEIYQAPMGADTTLDLEHLAHDI